MLSKSKKPMAAVEVIIPFEGIRFVPRLSGNPPPVILHKKTSWGDEEEETIGHITSVSRGSSLVYNLQVNIAIHESKLPIFNPKKLDLVIDVFISGVSCREIKGD